MANNLSELNDDPLKLLSTQFLPYYIFVLVCSLIYLWAYWGTWHVNILEYMPTVDIVKTTLYPLSIWLGSQFLGYALAEISEGDRGDMSTRRPTPRRWVTALVYAIVVAATFLLVRGTPLLWLFIVLGVFAFTPLAVEMNFRRPREARFGTTAMCIFLVFPPLSFAAGKIEADQVQNGGGFRYVVADDRSMSDLEVRQALRYVGHAGEYYFLLDPTRGTLTIHRMAEGDSIQLRTFFPSCPAEWPICEIISHYS